MSSSTQNQAETNEKKACCPPLATRMSPAMLREDKPRGEPNGHDRNDIVGNYRGRFGDNHTEYFDLRMQGLLASNPALHARCRPSI